MSEAVNILHAVERLVALAGIGPGADAGALKEVESVLLSMGLGQESSGYKSQKLSAVRDRFETWLGSRNWSQDGEDSRVFKGLLLRDIEHLRKALARGSEGQD
jgi:hypothetical protein